VALKIVVGCGTYDGGGYITTSDDGLNWSSPEQLFIIFLLLFYYNNKTYRTKLGYASFPAYPTKILHT